MNLIDSVPTGKTLKKSQINLLNKLQGFGVKVPSTPEVRVNQISGVSRQLDPLAVALFDFIIDSYRKSYMVNHQFNYNGHSFPVSVWDNARYLFLALWPEEYYDLID